MAVRKARRRTRKGRVIDQRSVQINQRTKLGSFLQKDHVINPQVGRKETGRVSGHQIVDMINHTLVNAHEAKVQGRIEIGREVKAQKETRTDHEAEVQEKAGVDHAVGVQEETKTGHAVGVLKGKDQEAEVREKLGIDHKAPVKATMANKDNLHQEKSNVLIHLCISIK